MKHTVVTGDGNGAIVAAGKSLRHAAMQSFVTSKPVYSKDEVEALAKWEARANEVVDSSRVCTLIIPPNTAVSLVLTIDAYDRAPRWHLSMVGLLPPWVGKAPRFGRVRDALAKRIVDIIVPNATEGLREGSIKDARHFFAPYEAP